MSQTHIVTFQGGPAPNPYASADMYNQHYNQNGDTELINLAQEAHVVRVKTRPYDWFICSVFGFAWTLYYWPFCVCWPGVCAMYYAIRANHTVDWERDEDLIVSHTRKAKCLTLTSIAIGAVLTAISIIAIAVMLSNLNSYRYDY